MPNSNITPAGEPSPQGFIGLNSYTEEQARFFFGRDAEISAVTALVKSNTLTLVFGKSGTGKTSLLNAGVFPGLRKNYCLPFRIRLEFKPENPDLVTQVKAVLHKEIDKYGFRVTQYPGTETLWEYFHREPLWKSITPILVLDQFEEMFTIAREIPRFSGKEIDDFWTEISDLIENRIPQSLHDLYLNHREQVTYNYKRQPVKVIFGFREEFLPNFETIPSSIPSMKYSRFRLMPMNENQAYEVITRTWGNRIDPKQAQRIISYLTSDEVITSLTVIEPALLSQICSFLDKKRQDAGSESISAGFLDQFPKETILRSIYDETMHESNLAVLASRKEPPYIDAQEKELTPVNTFVEENLITSTGYRMEYALKDSDRIMEPGIQVLLDRYFLRQEGKMGDRVQSVELTHDVLTPIIKSDRETRRNEMARIAAREKARKRALKIVLYTLLGVGLMFLLSLKYESRIVNEIINKTDTLNQIQKVVADSNRSLNNFRNRISRERQQYNDSLAGLVQSNGQLPAGIDTTLGVTKLRDQLNNLKLDSARLFNSNLSLSGQLTQLKASLDMASTQNNALQTNNQSLQQANLKLSNDLGKVNLEYQLSQDRIHYKELQYDSLVTLYLRIVNTCSAPVPSASPCEVLGTDSSLVSLMLKFEIPEDLKTGKKVPIPPNLTIYLIPDVPANRGIIRQASVFEIRANEALLKTAKGYQIARFCSGRYIFEHVPEGKYLIKVCTYYGGFRIYDKKVPGPDVVSVEIAPPIR